MQHDGALVDDFVGQKETLVTSSFAQTTVVCHVEVYYLVSIVDQTEQLSVSFTDDASITVDVNAFVSLFDMKYCI